MNSLAAIDFRHNDLTVLPSSVSQWNNIYSLYLEGNPLCKKLSIPTNLNGAKGMCEQQCSVDCNGDLLGNSMCDDNDYNYKKEKINLAQVVEE